MKARILVVDDSPTYLMALAEPLREDGHDVITAQSGEQALSLLPVQPIDCILLDLTMPGMSGQETCRRIKGNVAWRSIPLLMLTGREDREAMLDSFEAGADDYIAKSSEFSVLKARLRAQLRRKQFEDENRRIRDELVRKEVEATEARAFKELAETRAQLLKDIGAANDELGRTNRELESFSYSVSHDLRAPLRAIIGFGNILFEEHAKALEGEGLSHLTRVIDSARTMGQLIDGLLDLSRLARIELNAGTVDLSSLSKGVALELSESAPERTVEWVLPGDMKTHGDSRLLHSVIRNLLSNAWKYTSKRPDARIEFGQTADGDMTAFYVKDNGVGFDMTYADKLFGAFQRLHSAAEFEGTGIGLASVQRIIHRHGGKIWADAKPGTGATFFFTLKGESERR